MNSVLTRHALISGVSNMDSEEKTRPEISVVTTLFRSKPFLDRFVAKCLAAIQKVGYKSYELVFVNDGSPDESLEHILSLKARIPEIVVVDLSRHFGHHYAAYAGLSVSRGALVFLVDCDLEVSPAVLIDFDRELKSRSADVVYGFQQFRKGGWFERIGGGVFWRVFNFLSETGVPANLLTERLMTRQYVASLLELGDRNLFLAGMMYWAGFKQVGIPVFKSLRAGASTYSIFRRMALMVDAITSFSSQPLVALFYFGISITGLSFLAGLYLVIRRVVFADVIAGFTSLATLIVLSLGILTTCMGIIGIYLGKMFNQVKNRPIVIVKSIHR